MTSKSVALRQAEEAIRNKLDQHASYEDIKAANGCRCFDDRFARCETDWQRAVMQGWKQRHPETLYAFAGALGWMGVAPVPCHCAQCRTPSLIIPADADPDGHIRMWKDYCICPRCSQPKPNLQVVA